MADWSEPEWDTVCWLVDVDDSHCVLLAVSLQVTLQVTVVYRWQLFTGDTTGDSRLQVTVFYRWQLFTGDTTGDSRLQVTVFYRWQSFTGDSHLQVTVVYRWHLFALCQVRCVLLAVSLWVICIVWGLCSAVCAYVTCEGRDRYGLLETQCRQATERRPHQLWVRRRWLWLTDATQVLRETSWPSDTYQPCSTRGTPHVVVVLLR